jgi:hypothetical protein
VSGGLVWQRASLHGGSFFFQMRVCSRLDGFRVLWML